MSDYYTYKPKHKNDYHDSYRLAGLSDRMIALIIDSIAVGIIGGLFFAGSKSTILGIGVSAIIGVVYQWYFLTIHNGQTPGKMAMGIRVIKQNGERITGADAIVRYIGYHVNSWIFSLGWIWAAIDSENQGWHDKLAQTYVVKA